MLTHVQIKGYKSLKDVSLDMNSLTVLIGPNGSGKSNFLDIFTLIAEAAHGELTEGIIQRGGIKSISHRGSSNTIFRLAFDFDVLGLSQTGIRYALEVNQPNSFPIILRELVIDQQFSQDNEQMFVLRNQSSVDFKKTSGEPETKKLESISELAIFQVKDQTVYPIPYELLRQFQEWTCYLPMNVGIQSTMRLPQSLRHGYHLLPNGSNLFSVLHSIQSQIPDIWENIKEILRAIYPDFHSITFPSEGGEGKILLRWWEHPFEKQNGFSADLLSDGTLRLLALLAILKTPNPPPLICIEEPELGLHPDWIKLVAELLEEAATRTQIIVTTHSPTLVSHVQPKHVVVVEKEDGATYLERLSAEKLSAWLEEFQLGDLWLAGHLGGRP